MFQYFKDDKYSKPVRKNFKLYLKHLNKNLIVTEKLISIAQRGANWILFMSASSTQYKFVLRHSLHLVNVILYHIIATHYDSLA